MNLMLGFSMGHKLAGLTSWRQLLGSAQAGISPRTLTLTLTPTPTLTLFLTLTIGISPRTMSVLTLGKMLALPCVQCALLYGLLRGGASLTLSLTPIPHPSPIPNPIPNPYPSPYPSPDPSP